MKFTAFLGLLLATLFFGATTRAQTTQQEQTRAENARYVQKMKDLNIWRGEQERQIQYEARVCTTAASGNVSAYRDCLQKQKKAIEALKLEVERKGNIILNDHIRRLDDIGKAWDKYNTSSNRIDGRDGQKYVDKVPRPNVNRTQGKMVKGTIVNRNGRSQPGTPRVQGEKLIKGRWYPN